MQLVGQRNSPIMGLFHADPLFRFAIPPAPDEKLMKPVHASIGRLDLRGWALKLRVPLKETKIS